MNIKELKSKIQKKEYENVYLFYGEENYLKNKYLENIKNNIYPEKDIMNVDEFIGDKVRVEDILDAISTLPIFSDYRLVVVKNSKLFRKERKLDNDKLFENFNELSDMTILIFIEEEIDKRNRLYKLISKKGESVEFKKPKEHDMVNWIDNMLKKENIICRKDNIIEILSLIDGGMYVIEQEINKLIEYVGKGNEIKKDDIDSIVTKSLDVNIFELVDNIGRKNVSSAITIYNNMILIKEPPIKILIMISRQMKILLQCKYLIEKRENNKDIANIIGVSSYFINRYIKQSSNFSKLELYNILKKCLEVDENIKTGIINDVLGVEILILECMR